MSIAVLRMLPAHMTTTTRTTSIAFVDGARCLFARSYADTPNEAHFLSIAVGDKSRLLKDADLLDPLCVFAQAHLRREGKQQVCWLSGRGNGYEAVPASSVLAE